MSAPKRAAESEITRATLKNGLRVVIVRNSLAPVVTTQINYLVGSNEAPARLSRHGPRVGAYDVSRQPRTFVGAAFQSDRGHGRQFQCQHPTRSSRNIFLRCQPAISKPRCASRRCACATCSPPTRCGAKSGAPSSRRWRRIYSNPQYLFYSRLLAQMFAGTPYAHDALGTRPSFQKTTGAMLKDFHRKWYAPNNAILVIVGDVDPDGRAGNGQAIVRTDSGRALCRRGQRSSCSR